METSILKTIKQMLGPNLDDTQFDNDLIIHINSVFGILKQIGVGPVNGFFITGVDEQWSDFIPDASEINLKMYQDYIYLKVKMLFDPPINSSHINAINEKIKEFEWRLNSEFDTYMPTVSTTTTEEEY